MAMRTFTRRRNVPFAEVFARFIRLLDGHVTLAVMSFLVTFGGWVPLLINQESSRSYAVHMLPEVISNLQRFAMIGIFITVFLMLKMLPPPPPSATSAGAALPWWRSGSLCPSHPILL